MLLCYQHMDALKSTAKKETQDLKSIIQKSPKMILKLNAAEKTIKIFNNTRKHQLIIKNDIDDTKKLEFSTTFDDTEFKLEQVYNNLPTNLFNSHKLQVHLSLNYKILFYTNKNHLMENIN